jgi:hypothetical protein
MCMLLFGSAGRQRTWSQRLWARRCVPCHSGHGSMCLRDLQQWQCHVFGYGSLKYLLLNIFQFMSSDISAQDTRCFLVLQLKTLSYDAFSNTEIIKLKSSVASVCILKPLWDRAPKRKNTWSPHSISTMEKVHMIKCRLLALEDWVQRHESPCGVWGGRSGTRAVLYRLLQFFTFDNHTIKVPHTFIITVIIILIYHQSHANHHTTNVPHLLIITHIRAHNIKGLSLAVLID